MALRLGLVGRGRWGRNIERTLSTFPDVSLTIIARGDTPPARLDGVLIATPGATHADIALPYIEAGVATFIEKPMATTLADAERIRDAAARSGAIVFVGHIYLFHPAFLAALDLLPRLGPIRHVLCEGMNARPRTDSSVLWDWLPHDLAMAHAIFGRSAESAASWLLTGGPLTEAAVSKFQFGGTAMVCTTSWHSSERRRRSTVACQNGTLVFDDLAERRLALYDKQGEVTFPSYASDLPLTRELGAFIEAVRSGRTDGDHIAVAMSIIRAIAAAERSIALGGQAVAIG